MGDGDRKSADVRFSTLGPLEALIEAGPAVLGGPKQRAVLGLLLVRSNQVVSSEAITDALWPDAPLDRALDTLQVYVAKLRKSLGSSSAIETVRPGYRVAATAVTLDALAFEADLEQARRLMGEGRSASAVEAYERGLSRWRGRFLADLSGYDFVEEEAQRLHRVREIAEADLLEAHLALGHLDHVIPEAGRLIGLRPLDERLRATQMKALYRAGRQADALAAFQELRGVLVEELGIDPSAELRGLELRILEQDPQLLAPAPVDDIATVPADVGTPMEAAVEIDGERQEVTRAVTTLGRSADRAIVIDDPKVSRRHAEIRRLRDGFLLVDIGSVNGTLVNGSVVPGHCLLRDGDVIGIGDAQLVFRFG